MFARRFALIGGALPVLLLPSCARAQCSFAMLTDLDSILPVCCGGTAAEDCSGGMPARCSPECAELLVPYWDECSTMIQLMGGDMLTFDLDSMQSFIEPCTQTLLLQTSGADCAESADVDSWVQDVNTNCCTQSGINVCTAGTGIPWLCNVECALTFLPFVEYCMAPEDLTPEFAQLQTTCSSMNSYAPEEVAGLIADVNELADNTQCHIDTSYIVSADGTGGGSSCVNDPDGVLAGMRLSCPSDPTTCSELLSQTQTFGVVMRGQLTEGETVADLCPSTCLMCPGQHPCIDDDSFIQSAFGNPGASCEIMASTGLCSMLQDSDMGDRCCVSCPDDANGHRMLEEGAVAEDTQLFPGHLEQAISVATCPISSFFDRIFRVSATCCANADCQGGIPPTCDFACSRIYTPFLQDCGDVMQNLGWSAEEFQVRVQLIGHL